jgi:hypothetical protein
VTPNWRVLLSAAFLAVGCQQARDPAGPPRAADEDKAVTRQRLEKIAETFRPAGPQLPYMHYARSTNALGLSWRVGLLPQIGESELYRQFKFDEAWDSEHNKKLIEKMPEVFKAPRGGAPAGHTFYRVFLTRPERNTFPRPFPHTAYLPPMTEAQVKAKYAEGGPKLVLLAPVGPVVVDGTINTLFLVEAAEAVPWTKPDELVYDEDQPLPKLGGVYDDGFFAVSMAGAVVFVPAGTADQTLRALITSNVGDAIADKNLLDQLNAPFAASRRPSADPGKR